MPSLADVEFDIQQNDHPVERETRQDAHQYEKQQKSIPLPQHHFARLVNWNECPLSYFYDRQQPPKDFKKELETLHQYYIFLDNDRTIIWFFETHPAIASLLMGAIEPLRDAFGDRRLIYIRVQSSDEDSLLKVAILLPADFEGDPEHALQSFDEKWWLNNCHRSGGALVFDYEMQNAIRLA